MTEFIYAAQTTLAWNQPSTNEDGTPLQDLAGYRIYYGLTSKTYTQTIDVGNTTSHVMSNLLDGVTYYFAVTAYNSVGSESGYSNEVSKAFPKQYSLVVNRNGTGTVTSSPAGISCGSSCSGTYSSGTTVLLTATPAAGWIFSGWTGACTGSASTCQVIMDIDKTVNAAFLPVSVPTVTTSPASAIADTGATLNGTVDPNNGTTSVWFEYGKTTGYGNSTPQKNAGSGDSSMPVVEGAGGLASGTLYHYRIVAQNSVGKSNGNDMTFTTNVPPVTGQLSVSVVGKGAVTSLPAGIDCGTDCGEAYSDGVSVSLTTVPEAGWNFVRWSGACSGNGNCTITMNGSVSVKAVFKLPTKIGIFQNNNWYLDADGNMEWDARTDILFTFGRTGDVLVSGDWNGDGLSEAGVVRGNRWYLDVNGNGLWDPGNDTTFVFGMAGDIPVTGDWNGDGYTEAGVVRGNRWYIDLNGDNTWDTTSDVTFTFGKLGDLPVTGDWNGDGYTEAGVVRVNKWYLDWDGNRIWESGVDAVFTFGIAGDIPITGDWNGDGMTEVGIVRGNNWYLDADGNGSWNGPSADMFGRFGGRSAWIPVTGMW